MASNNEKPRWHDLAEKVSNETDSRKLTVLVEQLCAAFDKKIGSKGAPANPSGSQFDA